MPAPDPATRPALFRESRAVFGAEVRFGGSWRSKVSELRRRASRAPNPRGKAARPPPGGRGGTLRPSNRRWTQDCCPKPEAV